MDNRAISRLKKARCYKSRLQNFEVELLSNPPSSSSRLHKVKLTLTVRRNLVLLLPSIPLLVVIFLLLRRALNHVAYLKEEGH